MENFFTLLEQFNMVTAFVVFAAYIVIDGMYAYYTVAVTHKKPFKAASSGAVMHFMIAFGVLNYVENYLYIIPLALGSFIGTYLVVSRTP